jgi:hypothetical protein
MKITIMITSENYKRIKALPNYIRFSKAVETALCYCKMQPAIDATLAFTLSEIVIHCNNGKRLNLTLSKACLDNLQLLTKTNHITYTQLFIVLMPQVLNRLEQFCKEFSYYDYKD